MSNFQANPQQFPELDLFKNAQQQEESAVQILNQSLENVATMLIAAGARIETLESHVSFLLSQNKKYMQLLKKAKKQGRQDAAQVVAPEPQAAHHDQQLSPA
jgi:hypothetical protein